LFLNEADRVNHHAYILPTYKKLHDNQEKASQAASLSVLAQQ
jgi:hypothetical protein